MTQGWSMPAERRHRGRRLAALLGLVAVFAASVVGGWAVAGGTPGADGRAAAPSASPSGTAAAVASAAPTAAPTPTATPASTATPTPMPTPVPTPTPAVPKAMAARLDRALAAAQKSLLLPGVEATVIFADGSTWTGVRGYADVARKRKVTAATPFAIASVTKTFTSALILRYVEEGKLRLDDRLAKWLPAWPNAARITIRMLLNHTSGIPDYLQNPKFDVVLNRSKKRVWDPKAALDAYVPAGAVFPPGKGWGYSNSNYVLLGLVAEAVGGAPWATLVHDELIDPLGLTSTYVQGVDEPPAAPALAYQLIAGARGPTPQARTDGTDIVPFTSVVTAAGSAGAIASTTADLARWARALYGGTVLDSAMRRQQTTFVRAYYYGMITAYGLGVSRVVFQGRTAYGHTGALVGTRAAIRYFTADHVTIAVAFNRDVFVGDDVVRILAKAIFPAPPAPSRTASPRPTSSP